MSGPGARSSIPMMAKPTSLRRLTSLMARYMPGSSKAFRCSEGPRFSIASTFGTSQDNVEPRDFRNRKAATNDGELKLVGGLIPFRQRPSAPFSQIVLGVCAGDEQRACLSKPQQGLCREFCLPESCNVTAASLTIGQDVC